LKPFTLPTTPDPTFLTRHIDELRQAVRALNPEQLAFRTGANFEPGQVGIGRFVLELWGKEIILSIPEWIAHDAQEGKELPMVSQGLLLYYFQSADGAPVNPRWISFSELPDGRFYNQAFQGYTGSELGRAFNNDLEIFRIAAEQLGGLRQEAPAQAPGDAAYLFQALPCVSVLAAYWRGDEDLPASAQILFQASAPHYLPTDVCAILGSTLTRRLLAAKKNLP
jgi:hypothetical protein